MKEEIDEHYGLYWILLAFAVFHIRSSWPCSIFARQWGGAGLRLGMWLSFTYMVASFRSSRWIWLLSTAGMRQYKVSALSLVYTRDVGVIGRQ